MIPYVILTVQATEPASLAVAGGSEHHDYVSLQLELARTGLQRLDTTQLEVI